MTNNAAPLPYRPCVGIMLVNAAGRVFVGQRIDGKRNSGGEGDFWQMPQGGIDEGEDVRTAALRELEEETGITADKVALLAEAPGELFYDLPDELLGKLWSGRYRGQRQVWVLARFTGEESDIRLDAHVPPEFCDWKWVELETLPELIVPFKQHVYRAVIEAFRELI